MGMLEGKVALVTGAGGGLGRAHAMLLAREGASVVVNDLGGARDGTGSSNTMAQKVVEEIKAEGGQAIANYGSVTNRDDAIAMVEDTVSAFGKIDILIANAGILRDKSFKNMDDEMWDVVMDVHLRGTYLSTKAAYDKMLEQGSGGRIIMTSSTSGLLGNFGQTNYGAAKMGMLGMMNVLALEGAKNNVRVNTLAPAAATRMIATIPGREIDPSNPPAESAPSLVSPAVLYMTSEDAPNGAVINAGGGKFYRAQVYVNDSVDLGVNATFESLMAESDRLLDMTGAVPRGGML